MTLVLCSPTGRLLGALAPFPVDTPWWPDVEPVVAGARERYGADVIVLRLLEAAGTSDTMGGSVAYLAEIAGPVLDLTPADDHLRALAESDDPLRAPWARPGGLAATVAWADHHLADAGTPRTGNAVQVKTWNLSSVLRLPTAYGQVWAKSVPPFLGHEGAIIEAVGRHAPDVVPAVIAADRDDRGYTTALLADVPGEDQWEAPEPLLVAMIRKWVDVQADWADRLDELARLGLPDRRSGPLLTGVRTLAARGDVRAELADGDRDALDALVAALPDRLAELDACGLPDTLVHGDLHPGNWRSDGRDLRLLDWGDSGIGHPLLDQSAFLDRIPSPAVQRIAQQWEQRWLERMPASRPAEAARLLAPIAAARQAVIYRKFLDNIEPSEHPYHEHDPADWLRRTAEMARGERG